MLPQQPAVVIVASARTPMGAFLGALSSQSSPQLGATAISGALAKAGLTTDRVSETLMGCVLPAGCGQAPARQAAKLAGIPDTVPATTINKVCGSGMKAVMLGAAQLQVGEADVVVAGGMESMSNAPYLLSKVRGGLRLGHGTVRDHLFTDGLEDAYAGRLMGQFAQQTADRFNISRTAMDDYALMSLTRTQQAIKQRLFDDEMVPVATEHGVVNRDEPPSKAKLDKIRSLKPVFTHEGTITAANASSIADGAAALVLMREQDAIAQGLQPLARIAGYLSHAGHPAEFTLAPIGAIDRLLQRLHWQTTTVDLYEINEAFAVVVLLAMQKLGLDPKQVNIHGGACALGHPLGASGTRIIVTLLHALQRQDGRRGVASLCIGGGEATAVAIELL